MDSVERLAAVDTAAVLQDMVAGCTAVVGTHRAVPVDTSQAGRQ